MEETTPLFSLNIDPNTKTHLGETARWARFLAIIGMVVLVLIIALGVYSSVTISRYEEMYGQLGVRNRGVMDSLGISLAVTYVIMAIISFFPLLFMLRFANQMRSALGSNDQALLNSSFQNLKIYFRYLGIVTIIVLVLMVLSFILGIAGSAVSS